MWDRPGPACLTRRGHGVLGLDVDPRLIEGLEVAEVGDARGFELKATFSLVMAPMQLVQLFAMPRSARAV